MKSKTMTHWRYLHVGVFALLVIPCLARAQIEGDAELLRLVGEGYKANVERIRTWQGQARMDDTDSRTEEGRTDIRKTSVEFVVDNDNSRLRWYSTLIEGQYHGETLSPGFTSGIVKEGRLYRLYPVSLAEDRPPGNVSIEPLSARHRIGVQSEEFDPMIFFTPIPSDPSRRMLYYYEKARDPNLSECSIKREGDIVVFDSVLGSSLNRYVFDLSRGCMLIRYLGEDESIRETWDVDVEEVSGVFVPKTVKYENVNRERSTVFTRTVAFTKHVINMPVDAGEFEIDKLRLKPGDKIQDLATGAEWRYHEGLLDVPGAILKTESNLLNDADKNRDGIGQEDRIRTASRTPQEGNESPVERTDSNAKEAIAQVENSPVVLSLVVLAAVGLLVVGAVVVAKYKRR